MNKSAQAIVVDRNGNMYFEDNSVTGMLSFIGGKCEGEESFELTLIREVKEELGLLFSQERFLDGQEQPVRSFWNERKGTFVDWFSKYFVLILNAEDVVTLGKNVKIIVVSSLGELEKFPDEKFFPLGREVFVNQVQRALSHIS